MTEGRPLRILHCAAPTRAGGLERVVESLAVGHHRAGHHVGVAALLVGGESARPFTRALASAGVAVFPLAVPPRGYLAERRAIAEVCGAFRPDVVHTHGYRTDVVDRGVAARGGTPTVTTLHGYDHAGGLKGALYEWIQRRNCRRFDAVVAVSRPLAELMVASGVAAHRVHCIPNAWAGLREPMTRAEARGVLGVGPEDRVLGWVGRLLPVKGGDTLLDALAMLPAPRPLTLIIGDGPERTRLERQAVARGVAGQVRFCGPVDDAGRLFAGFDLFVLSSRSEGLPIVVLEAMAAGTPVVATQVGALPDVLSGREAWLVPPESPVALAEAIARALAAPEDARARADAAGEHLRTRFALDPWLARYEAVYRGVVR